MVHPHRDHVCSTDPEPGLLPSCANGLDRTGAVDAPNAAASNNAAFDAFDTVLEWVTPPSESTTDPRYIDDTDRSEKCTAADEEPITSSTIRLRSTSSAFARGSMRRVPSVARGAGHKSSRKADLESE